MNSRNLRGPVARRRNTKFSKVIENLEPRVLLAAIGSDQTLTGNLSAANEVDEFTFTAAPGDSIVAFVAETSAQNLDPRIELITPDSTSVIFDFGEVGADIFAPALTQTGTYKLRVSDNGSNDTGNYAITMVKAAGAQSTNDGNGGLITSGQRKSGTISAGDMDVFTFSANTGESVALSAAESATTAFDPQVIVYGPDGAEVTDDDGEVGADLFFAAPSNGTYYVVIKDRTSNGGGVVDDIDVDTGSYTLNLMKVDGPQTDDSGDGGAITSGERKTGTITLGDLDIFTIDGTAGQSAVISLGDSTGTEFDPHFVVYDPNGAFVVEDYGQDGADEFFKITTTGTYYVLVKDRTSNGGGVSSDVGFSTGAYTINLAKLAGPQTDDSGDGGAIASGNRKTGTITLGDLDIFTFDAAAGDTIILNAADIDGTPFETHLLVYDPTGALLTEDFGDGGADLFFTAATTGKYFAVMKDLTRNGGGVNDDVDVDAGFYALTMARLPAAQNDDAGEGSLLTSGQRVVGTIALGDIDVWTLNVKAGDSIAGVCRSIEIGSSDMEVYVYHSDGTFVAQTNGTLDCDIQLVTASKDETLYIVVKDHSPNGGGVADDVDVEAGEYAMTFFTTSAPAFVDADSGALASGSSRAGSVSVGDLDVYTFTGVAGQAVTINLAETSLSGLEPSFRIFRPDGMQQTLQGGSASASATFTPSVGGTYKVVVYDADGNASGPYSIALNSAVGTDTFAPRVLGTQYQFDGAPNLRVLFTEDIQASVSLADVTLTNLDTAAPVSNANLLLTYQPTDDLFKITFPGFAGAVLPDGHYRLAIPKANIVDPAGNPLDSSVSFDFFVLAADANRDQTVNDADYNIWASQAGHSLRVFSQGDFNYNGSVGSDDLSILLAKFGKTLGPVGSITGSVYNDLNFNGTKDASEVGLAGRVVYMDVDQNNQLSAGEPQRTTDASGNYSFANIGPGNYFIRHVFASGVRKTQPGAGISGYNIPLAVSQNSSANNFGNTKNILIGGTIFNDANSNGVKDAGEAGLPGVVISIIANNQTIATRTTDANGQWKIQGLAAGTGQAKVTIPAGYIATNPAGGVITGTMTSGQQNANLNFGLHKTAPSPVPSAAFRQLLAAVKIDALIDDLV